MVAGVGKLLLRPGLRDNVERFQKTAATLDIWHIVALIVSGQPASPHPKIKAALTDVVHRGGFFGDAQGIRQRQHLHGQSDTDPLGPGRDGAGNHERRGQYGAFGAKMVLRQPDGVDAELFGFFDLSEGLIERLCLRHVLAYVEVSKHPEVHRCLLARSEKIMSIQRCP